MRLLHRWSNSRVVVHVRPLSGPMKTCSERCTSSHPTRLAKSTSNPLSVTPVDHNGVPPPAVELAIAHDAIFTTAVGASTKQTLAGWYVTTPEEVVNHMLHLVGETSRGGTSASGPRAGHEAADSGHSVGDGGKPKS
ncbi:hypothetical protein JVU11DRAFT_10053 [Chiua virens]|nr:hypothetical protein JVU11DRAFT_10053 [Chiua virens]